VNYFTIGYTSSKYLLVGKLLLSGDSYEIIIKNNFRVNNVIRKKLLISEVNEIGIRDGIIGFYMFICGILILFNHIFLCCKGVKEIR